MNMDYNYYPNYYTGGYNGYNQTPQYPAQQSPQERLQRLEQQYPQYTQQGQGQGVQPPQRQLLIPVANEQEARSYPSDLSGATLLFINKTTGQIYSKQFNVSTGLFDFEIYEKKMPDQTAISPCAACTCKDYSDVIVSLENKYVNLERKFNDKFTDLERSWANVQSTNVSANDGSAESASTVADTANSATKRKPASSDK